MAMKDVDKIILNHWFRILMKSELPFDDILKIIMDFAEDMRNLMRISQTKELKLRIMVDCCQKGKM